MSYTLEFTSQAYQEQAALPGHVRAELRRLIPELLRNPRPPRATELRGKPNIYRIWLARRWRLAYTINEEQQHIIVLRVRLKDDIDYESLEAPE